MSVFASRRVFSALVFMLMVAPLTACVGAPNAGAPLSFDAAASAHSKPQASRPRLVTSDARIVLGRITPIESTGRSICEILSPAVARAYDAEVSDCADEPYTFQSGKRRTVLYRMGIALSGARAAEVAEFVGPFLPEATITMPDIEPGRSLCGRFRVRDLNVGAIRYTIIVGPVNEQGKLDYEFKGTC